MKNKVLIPLLLTALSGCSVNPSSESVQLATGAGAAGSANPLKSLTISTRPTKQTDRFKRGENANTGTKKVPFEQIHDPFLDEPDNSIDSPDIAKLKDYEVIDGESDKIPTALNDETGIDNSDEDNLDFDSKRGQSKRKQTLVYEYPAYNGQAPNGKPMLKLPKPSSAGNPTSYSVGGVNYKVLPFSNGFVERGIASWYGSDFHGEKTSNGEIYDMFGMTAAHKRLPIPSYVKVTNLKNKRSVVLRINDRGPFHDNRVIDLSYAAAQKLDIHQVGTEEVKIEAIKTPRQEKVYLQLGVFTNPAYAQLLQKKLVEHKLPEPVVQEIKVGGKTAYRVQLGPLFNMSKINEFHAKLAKLGISQTWYVTENKIN
jgi:rare lipoprotein A